MNKAELVSRMAEKSELTKKEAEMALNALMESIQEASIILKVEVINTIN